MVNMREMSPYENAEPKQTNIGVKRGEEERYTNDINWSTSTKDARGTDDGWRGRKKRKEKQSKEKKGR